MFEFKSITMKEVDEISRWTYQGFMKTIYMKPYYDNYNEQTNTTKGPADCKGYAVYKDNLLFGLFEYYFYDGVMEIGLAIHPNMVGKGLSTSYILEGIKFGITTFQYQKNVIQLHVEILNKAAYYAYVKAGFTEISRDEEEILMYYYI